MAKHTGPAMGTVEWVLLFTLAILWGGSFFFIKLALAELQPLTVVLGRAGVAALGLNIIVRASRRPMPRSLSFWGAITIMSVLNNLVPFSLLVWGQTQIASGLASILNATTPIFTVVLAHLLTKDERATATRLAGVLFGLAGVAVMMGPEALAGFGLNGLAQLACVGAALSYACAGIYGRRFTGVPPLVTATGQVTMTTVMILPIALLADRPWTLPAPGLRTWGAILGLSLLSTALAYVVYFRILAAAGATNLLLVTLLIPVTALFLGMTILGERLDPRHFVGMALIGCGLAAIDGRPLSPLRGYVPSRHHS